MLLRTIQDLAMFVCVCKGITDSQIQGAIDKGADYKELRETFGVGTDCGQCGNTCKQMINTHKLNCEFYEIKAA